MGLFGRPRTIKAVYGSWLGDPDFGKFAYTFAWPFREQPRVGMPVIIPGLDGLQQGYVAELEGERGDFEIKSVARLGSWQEVEQLRQDEVRTRQVWLDRMALHAGLPPHNSGTHHDPRGLPPQEGEAGSEEEAAAFAREWWKAYRHARSSAEESRFQEIARHWFRERDAFQARREDERRLQLQPAAGVRGHHFTYWVDEIKRLRRAGEEESALALLYECQAATLRVDGARPAPWYFEQAAIILRKLKRPVPERNMLRAYCRAAAEPSEKLLTRLMRVESLIAPRD